MKWQIHGTAEIFPDRLSIHKKLALNFERLNL